MENTALYRKPLNAIQFDALSVECRNNLHEASRKLVQFSPVAPDFVLHAHESLFRPLHHRLSDAYLALNGTPDYCVRSEIEHSSLRWLESQHAGFEKFDKGAFAKSVEALNVRLLKSQGGYRKSDTRMSRDALGNTICFPSHINIPSQLVLLAKVLRNCRAVPTIFVATLSLVLLTNCHPFRDGNGRVGRILFNYALRRGGISNDVYIPFYEIAARSNGGYQIALRQAEIRGEWEPLFEYVIKMIDVFQNLHSAKSS